MAKPWKQSDLIQNVKDAVASFQENNDSKNSDLITINKQLVSELIERTELIERKNRDISEQALLVENANEQILKALNKEKELNDLKSQFVTLVSHEIKNPLADIQSNTELLIFLLEGIENKLKDKVDRSLTRINDDVERLKLLSKDVLSLSNAESKKFPLRPKKMDLIRLTKKITDQTVWPIIPIATIGEPYEVLIDPSLYQLLLQNLISNAHKVLYNPKATMGDFDI